MNKKLKAKIHESLSSVLPVTLIVLALGMTIAPMELSTLMLFLVGGSVFDHRHGLFHAGGRHGHDAHRRSRWAAH